jgi:hypothetical protein
MNKTFLLKKYCALLSATLAFFTLSPVSLHAELSSTTPTASSTTPTADQNPRRARLRRLLLRKFDTNHNGKLDPNEIEALKKWIEERRAKRGQKL